MTKKFATISITLTEQTVKYLKQHDIYCAELEALNLVPDTAYYVAGNDMYVRCQLTEQGVKTYRYYTVI